MFDYKKIFFWGFVLNLVWENLHYQLYVPIHFLVQQPYMLFLAAFLDAVYVAGLVLFLRRYGTWAVIWGGLVFAALIEWYALFFNWWQYTDAMPIVPVLGVGLSPFVQLALTSFLALIFVFGKSLRFKLNE